MLFIDFKLGFYELQNRIVINHIENRFNVTTAGIIVAMHIEKRKTMIN